MSKLFLLNIAGLLAKKDNIVKHTLTDVEATQSGARALDGSPYAWYQSPKSAHIRDWIIYLEGGGECGTHADCVDRSTSDLGTSTVRPNKVDRNADVSDGDDWLGSMRVPCVPWGAHQNCSGGGDVSLQALDAGKKKALWFAGALNFEAAIRNWREGLNQPPRHVLLSGGSAGGQGAFFLADRLRELLPDTDTVVKVNPQYGWFAPPTDTFNDWQQGRHTDPKIPYPSPSCPYAVPAWCYNISLALPQACVAAADARGDNPLVCTSTPTVAKTIGVPLFISANLFDGWLTDEMEGVPSENKIKEGDIRLEYLVNVTAPATRASVREAVDAHPQDRAAFIPACMEHPMAWAGLDDWWAEEGAPTLGDRKCNLADAVASWFFEDDIDVACESVLIDERASFAELAAMPCNGDSLEEGLKASIVV